jgi:predicted phosphodiesterase
MSSSGHTVAVLSDVHGNAAALRAVLADLRKRPYDDLVFAGDYVLFGPRPAEALDLVRAQSVPTIYGNTDRFITHATAPPWLSDSVDWVANRLDRDSRAYLQDLPFKHRITPPGGTSPDDDLLIVHATPTDVDAVLLLEPQPFEGEEVTEPAAAMALLGEVQAHTVVYGHIHYASAGTIDDRQVVSIGAVGFPFDGDPRAAYGLAHWEGGAWRIEHIRVSYDHEIVANELKGTDAPFAGFASERLRQARFVPRDI